MSINRDKIKTALHERAMRAKHAVHQRLHRDDKPAFVPKYPLKSAITGLYFKSDTIARPAVRQRKPITLPKVWK